MVRFGRLQPSELARIEQESQSLALTYPEVGGTGWESLPLQYQHLRASVVIGNGGDDFSRGQAALRSWAAHAQIGATITPADADLRQGVTVVVMVPFGPVVVLAPCRIVSVVDTADVFGFAYGTLPGHPECGEESFTIRRDSDGQITFDVVAFSRPSEVLVRLGGPLSRQIQRRATRGYLEGVRRFVADSQSRR